MEKNREYYCPLCKAHFANFEDNYKEYINHFRDNEGKIQFSKCRNN